MLCLKRELEKQTMGGKCTCCNDWCYEWTPENDISKFLRENYHYDGLLLYRLESLFGDNFLKKCNTKEQVNAVMDMLKIIAKFDGMIGCDDG